MRIRLALLLLLLPALSASAVETGAKAPPLEILTWVRGEAVTPAKPDGRTTYVVDFWGTWCPPCRRSIPHLNVLHRRYAGSNIVVVGVSQEAPGKVKPFAAKMQMAYRVAVDDAGKTTKAYMGERTGFPHAFVVDTKGEVAWSGHPLVDLENVLDEIVAGTFDVERWKKIAAREEELKKAMRGRGLAPVLTVLDELIALRPDGYRYYKTKMRIYKAQGNRDALGDTVDAAVKGCAASPKGLGKLALDLACTADLAQRDAARGLELAEKAAALSKRKDARVLATLARVYHATGLLAEAVTAQKEAVALAENADRERFESALGYLETVKSLRDKRRAAGEEQEPVKPPM